VALAVTISCNSSMKDVPASEVRPECEDEGSRSDSNQPRPPPRYPSFTDLWTQDANDTPLYYPPKAMIEGPLLAHRAFVPPVDLRLTSATQRRVQDPSIVERAKKQAAAKGMKSIDATPDELTFPSIRAHDGTREVRIWIHGMLHEYLMLRLWTSRRLAGTPWNGEVDGEFFVWRYRKHGDARDPEVLVEQFHCESFEVVGEISLCHALVGDVDWKKVWQRLEGSDVSALPGDYRPIWDGLTMEVQLGLASGERLYRYDHWEGKEGHHVSARVVRAEVERLRDVARKEHPEGEPPPPASKIWRPDESMPKHQRK